MSPTPRARFLSLLPLLPRPLLPLLLTALLTVLLLERAGAQAVYVPPAATIGTVPGLQSALNGKNPSRILVGVRDSWSGTSASNGTDTSANVRVPEIAGHSFTDVSLVFVNSLSTPYTVSTTVEYPAGTFYRCTFGNQPSAVVAGGTMVVSDPCPVFIPAGAIYEVRHFVTVAAGNSWPNSVTYGNYAVGPEGYSHGTTQTDQTANAAFTYADAFEGGFSHTAILATTAASYPSVLIVGDSIAAGQGDANTGPTGYPADALYAAGIGFAKIAIPGETSGAIQGTGGALRLLLAKFANVAIDEYGVNDIAGGSSLAGLQASEMATWQLLWVRRLKVFACTLTPETNSTDGWATPGSQTPKSAGFGAAGVTYGPAGSTFVGTGVRTSYNDWLRAGAPVASATNITAVAPGTAGAVPCPYLTGTFDVADKIESSRNSGAWASPPPPLLGTVTSFVDLGGYNVRWYDSTKNVSPSFFSGATLTFPGGSNSGRTGYVNNFTNNPFSFQTSATYNPAIGDPYKFTFSPLPVDGTHPNPDGHNLAAAAIDTTKLTP